MPRRSLSRLIGCPRRGQHGNARLSNNLQVIGAVSLGIIFGFFVGLARVARAGGVHEYATHTFPVILYHAAKFCSIELFCTCPHQLCCGGQILQRDHTDHRTQCFSLQGPNLSCSSDTDHHERVSFEHLFFHAVYDSKVLSPTHTPNINASQDRTRATICLLTSVRPCNSQTIYLR